MSSTTNGVEEEDGADDVSHFCNVITDRWLVIELIKAHGTGGEHGGIMIEVGPALNSRLHGGGGPLLPPPR